MSHADGSRKAPGRPLGAPWTTVAGRSMVTPIAMLATCLLAAGCGPTLELELLGSPAPSNAIVDSDQIAIELGTAVGVRVTNGGTHFDDDVEIAMVSEAPQVLTVAPSLDNDEFVIWGAALGQTAVTVELEGDAWERIDAEVFR